MSADRDLVVVEGAWAVEALLDNAWFSVCEVCIEEGRHAPLLALCRERSVKVSILRADEMCDRLGYDFHRGVYATALRPAPREPDEAFLASARRVLVPVDLADGGNLGTLIRSAAAFGVDGVVVGCGRGTDVYSRKCIRSSATAIFRVPVFEVASLEATLERLVESGFILLGSSVAEGSRPLTEVRAARRTALLMGAEGEGLPAGIESLCAERVRIPMIGGLDSLNVAASGAILMWEWFGKPALQDQA